jgi:phosphatidylserine/phosphatidylglycerophosphate/cardiolipin synthase-like enzyme
MNAEPILGALLDAVRRGVTVTCHLCLGYNDAGQLLPFQNGTNEMIANRLYRSLRTDEERSRLRIYNYVAKDQTKPIHNKYKKRSCHVKLMIIDEQVAIQGEYYTTSHRRINIVLTTQETETSTRNPFTTVRR